MLPLPTGLLALPSSGDGTVRRLRRKVRLLGARELLLGSEDPPLRSELKRCLEEESARALDAVGSLDVLPALLAARSGALSRSDALAVATPNLRRALGLPTDTDTIPQLSELPGSPVRLALADSNPLADREAHPDKTGNAWSLGGHLLAEWQEALGAALALLDAHLPEWTSELPVSLERLVPVGYEPELHLSASYREAPGLAYLTLHPNVVTLAEAIVHETQHGKLMLLTWLDPVLRNGNTTWTRSPVRPDLRPLMGVLLAVHAFVPVAALHARLAAADHPSSRTPHFAKRRQDVLAGNENGLRAVQDLGDPTPPGGRVIAALQELHEATMREAPGLTIERGALPPG